MSEYITLERGSPQFESYLRGTFSKTQRALPIKSLNVNSASERVTFQLVPLSEIKRPALIGVWIKVLRVRSYLVVLFPMFYILTKNIIFSSVADVWTTAFSTVGTLFLFTAFILRNDFIDYMKGFDRIDSDLEGRPLQLGWLAADSVRKAANISLAISLLLAFAVFIAFPATLLFVVVAAFVGYLTLFRMKDTFKEIAGGELGILLLVGPLLTCGYEMSVAGSVRDETLFFGFIWGWMALLPIHLRNLGLLVSQSQAGLNNIVTYLGFDKGKRFIHYWWFLAVVFFIFFHFKFAGFFWFWFYSLVLIFISLRFSQYLAALESPIGSHMANIRKQGAYILDIVMSLWLIEWCWYLFL